MLSVTIFVTTFFSRQFTYNINYLRLFLCPFIRERGVKGGAYCHQNTHKSLIYLLKEPVFIVVTKVVTRYYRREF